MIIKEIKTNEVVLVSEDGLVEMSAEAAKAEAEKQGLDLVVVNEKDGKTMVKILDYSKYKYEKAKQNKENKKKQRLNTQSLKEIQISDAIAQHDLEIKAKNIDRILSDGDKVQISIKYKGRAIRNIKQGPEKLQQLVNLVTVKHKIDKTPKIEGNRVIMVISPVK